MPCLNPRFIDTKTMKYKGEKRQFISRYIKVNCGKCHECLKSRRNTWSLRLQHELEYCRDNNMFLTLTYDDDSKKTKKDELRADISHFLKLLKDRGHKFKYFGVCELGDKTFRPHFHLLILGWKADDLFVIKKYGNYFDSNYIKKTWKFGHITVGTVTQRSINYVCNYIMPKNGSLTLFPIFSQGIGLQKALDDKENIKKLKNYTIKGTNFGIPRYYIKKIFGKLEPEQLAELKLNRAMRDKFFQKLLKKGLTDAEIMRIMNNKLVELEENFKWQDENLQR